MVIKYLGTAAAEGVPAVFCHCDVCNYSRQMRGRNIRTRSQVIIDNMLLIDFGPDTYWHSLQHGINLADIHHCLISHPHADHLYPDDLKDRRRSRANLKPGTPPLSIYGSRSVLKALQPYSGDTVTKDASVVFHELFPYKKSNVAGYFVTPLPAVHGTEMPFVYIIEHDNVRYLYGHDSDILRAETLDYIKQNQIRFDCISLDCTEGIKHIDYEGHMNLERFLVMCEKLTNISAIDQMTVKIASHFSHNGLVSYDDILRHVEDQNITIAYDGMEVRI